MLTVGDLARVMSYPRILTGGNPKLPLSEEEKRRVHQAYNRNMYGKGLLFLVVPFIFKVGMMKTD